MVQKNRSKAAVLYKLKAVLRLALRESATTQSKTKQSQSNQSKSTRFRHFLVLFLPRPFFLMLFLKRLQALLGFEALFGLHAFFGLLLPLIVIPFLLHAAHMGVPLLTTVKAGAMALPSGHERRFSIQRCQQCNRDHRNHNVFHGFPLIKVR